MARILMSKKRTKDKSRPVRPGQKGGQKPGQAQKAKHNKNCKINKWNENNIREAIEEHRSSNGSVSIRQLARAWNVPRSTLKMWIDRKVDGSGHSSGRKPVFDAATEQELVAGGSGESTSTDDPDPPAVADVAAGTGILKEPAATGFGNFVTIPQRLKRSTTKKRKMENYKLTSSEHIERITGASKKKEKKVTNCAGKKVNTVNSNKPQHDAKGKKQTAQKERKAKKIRKNGRTGARDNTEDNTACLYCSGLYK